MTAINVLKTSDAVHVLTDGKVTTPGLPGQANVAKMMPLPHLNAALVTRGPTRLLGLMAMMLSQRAATFGALWGELLLLRWICGEMREEPWQVETLAAEFDVVVAGIGASGPQAFLVSNHDKHGFAPWHVFEIPWCLVTPAVSQDLLDDVFGSDDPLAEMPRLVDAQRADPAIGGFVQQTSITTAGITTRIVRDYR